VLDADTRRRFEDFARQQEPGLLAIAVKLCRNRDEAQDLVQDTLEYALLHFSRLEVGPKARAWLGTVMRHRFIDGRRRSRGASLEEEVERGGERWAAPEAEEEPAWAKVTAEQHRAAVEQLPGELRDVYRMKAVEGLSYQEISKRLQVAAPTVGTRLLRARKHLKELLTSSLSAGQEASS